DLEPLFFGQGRDTRLQGGHLSIGIGRRLGRAYVGAAQQRQSEKQDESGLFHQAGRISNRPAAPMPPPMHMVTTPSLAPRRRPSSSRWPVMGAPDRPQGRAMGRGASI